MTRYSISILLASFIAVSAHATSDCDTTAQLKCSAIYFRQGAHSPLAVPDQTGKTQFVDLGEPSLDECKADVAFNQFGVILYARVSSEGFTMSATQGSYLSSTSSAVEKGKTATFYFTYPKPFKSNGIIVYGAQLSCMVNSAL
jgi:hypothetical protein